LPVYLPAQNFSGSFFLFFPFNVGVFASFPEGMKNNYDPTFFPFFLNVPPNNPTLPAAHFFSANYFPLLLLPFPLSNVSEFGHGSSSAPDLFLATFDRSTGVGSVVR